MIGQLTELAARDAKEIGREQGDRSGNAIVARQPSRTDVFRQKQDEIKKGA